MRLKISAERIFLGAILFFGISNAVLAVCFHLRCERRLENLSVDIERRAEEILSAAENESETIRLDINDRCESIENRLARTEAVYSMLLSEEKKRKISDVVLDAENVKRLDDAAMFYRKGKYAQAASFYGQARRDGTNDDLEFHYWHSLYLSNPMDSSAYPGIRAAFEKLESKGFARKEISEVLEYIRSEENRQ